MNASLCAGFGAYHTNEADPVNPKKKLTAYVGITLDGIRALVGCPQEVSKQKAQWVISSTLFSRSFARQEQEGEFWFLWADLDTAEPSMMDTLVEIYDGCAYEIYTSKSATKENPKCRILLPLSKPLCGADWILCQEILNDDLEAEGITPDRASEQPAQLCYLPNRGKFYDSRSNRENSLLDPLDEWGDEIAKRRQALVAKAREMEVLKEAAAARRAALPAAGTRSLIETFNQAYSVPEMLLKAGYAQRGKTFRHPRSESGSYSASVKDGRVHSLSSRDPLYTGGGGGGGGAHDAFSVLTVLWAGGDRNIALKLAGDEWLEIGGESWNTVKQRDYKTQGDMKTVPPLNAETDIETFFDDLVLRSEDVKKMADAEFLIPNMIVRGHVAAYVSPGGGGKTTIFVHLCEKLAAMGLTVLYINVDGSPGDLKRHFAHAAKHGYKVIAPDAKDGKSTEDVLKKLKTIAAGNAQCGDIVFIIDTLKKFLDVINKREAKEFNKLMRAITVKGATICLLGHTNKYKGEDGRHIFEGTADLRNDHDELIYLDSCQNETNNTLEVTTRPDKVRAEFAPKSFIIHLPERSVTEPPMVLNILDKETRELLDLIKAAIMDGQQSQKDIIAWVKPKTVLGEKKIRSVLLYHSQGDFAEIKVESTGRGKDLHYSIAPSPFASISMLTRAAA